MRWERKKVKTALTDLGLQRLKPGTYFDTKTPAFGIRVGKHRRTWLITKGQDRKVITLGHYPDLSLADARKRALVALGSPLQVQAAITFPEARTLFLAQDRWRAGSLRVLKSNLNKFTWTRPLVKITYEDVSTALEAIEKPSARAHALKDIRTFFNWCIPRYLSASPAAGIKMEAQPSRDRVLTDAELKAVWIAAGELGQFGVIVKLLMLTGQRRTEIATLQRSWLDQNSITFPKEVTKNGRLHHLPLRAICASFMPAVSPSSSTTTPASTTYLFPAPGTANAPITAWSKNQAALLKLSKTSGWTLHDIRRTVATNLAALGTPIHVTEKILNHVSGSLSGVAGIYNRHNYWDEMQVALDAWENRLQEIVR